jgi:hypothetical protein
MAAVPPPPPPTHTLDGSTPWRLVDASGDTLAGVGKDRAIGGEGGGGGGGIRHTKISRREEGGRRGRERGEGEFEEWREEGGGGDCSWGLSMGFMVAPFVPSSNLLFPVGFVVAGTCVRV